VTVARGDAALHQFTLEGTITYSIFGVNPTVGERCIIRYTADNGPPVGLNGYFATPPKVSFPDSNTMLSFEPAEFTRLLVSNGTSGSGIDFVAYQSFRSGGGVNTFDLSLTLIFPDHILQSIDLPLDLPMDQATSTNFFIGGGLIDYARGRITSYSSAPVPEPSGSLIVLAAAFTVLLERRLVRMN
jgi:hypothetical protein